MLEELDKIKWFKLEHAYGSAKDIPDCIRNLINSDEKVREKAHWTLYGNIFHQGTRYEASKYAVPFLYELLEASNIPDKAWIIMYLVHLALGYPERYLPFGYNKEEAIRAIKYFESKGVVGGTLKKNIDTEKIKDFIEKDKKEEEQVEFSYNDDDYAYRCWKAELETYEEVRKNISRLIPFLECDDIDLQAKASFALAWFPEEANKIILQLREYVKKKWQEKKLANILNGILSLGMIDMYLKDQSDIEFFQTIFQESKDIMIKAVATIALIHILQEKSSKEIINNLIEIMIEINEIESKYPTSESVRNDSGHIVTASLDHEENESFSIAVTTDGGIGPGGIVLFNEGDILGYISRLFLFFNDHLDVIVSPLCNILKRSEGQRAIQVTNTLFNLTITNLPSKDSYFFEELNAYTIQVLKILTENQNIWKLSGMDYANFSLMMRDWRLPGTYEELKYFLEKR